MASAETIVANADELLAAARDTSVRIIVVRSALANLPSCRLAPGQVLVGEGDQAVLSFAAGSDGLQLSSDNEIVAVRLETSIDRRAIFNDPQVDSLGRIRIAKVRTVGQVQILARESVRGGHVAVDGLDIISADARDRRDRPHGFGVDVLQGAFTLWNMQPDEKVILSAEVKGLSVGRPGAPVLGSGAFVSGAGFEGGKLVVSLLETGAVYCDGRIDPGTPDRISGGVFTVYNAFVALVRNLGPVVTYGVNDMVLDNWGTVDRWMAEEPLTSYGPSGIGFVNFGMVNALKVSAPIETFGKGARGFNVYAGSVNVAEFDRITTHGDGSVGIQISQPIGHLIVRRGIETFGSTGESLVKGEIVTLSAIPLSVKPGGSARKVEIEGAIVAHGKGIPPIDLHGTIGALRITEGLQAAE